MVANDSFPLRHLHRMHLIFPGNLPDRFDAHQSFQSDFGFKGTRVSFPFSFTHSPAVLSPPAEPEKSNLSYCPNSGVHFSEISSEAKSAIQLLVEGDVVRAFELDDVIAFGLIFVISPGVSVLEEGQPQFLTRQTQGF